jgi:hypothetical protein
LSKNSVSEKKINPDFYRQAEVSKRQIQIADLKNFDKSVEAILQKFCYAMIEELKTSVGAKAPEPETFVDRYGKEFPGFITLNEFKEIYLAHVHYPEQMVKNTPQPSDNLLRALFNTICSDSRNKLSREHFGALLRTK